MGGLTLTCQQHIDLFPTTWLMLFSKAKTEWKYRTLNKSDGHIIIPFCLIRWSPLFFCSHFNKHQWKVVGYRWTKTKTMMTITPTTATKNNRECSLMSPYAQPCSQHQCLYDLWVSWIWEMSWVNSNDNWKGLSRRLFYQQIYCFRSITNTFFFSVWYSFYIVRIMNRTSH